MDIGITWNNDTGQGDWVIANGDLLPGNDLESAVMVSLFTDAYATTDFTPNDGTTNRRGFWGSTFEDAEIGSNLWQFDRAKITDGQELLLRARDYVKLALQWMIDTGVADSISVVTSRLGLSGLGIAIVITRPVPLPKVPFQFSYYWSQELGS
jgi:phage gp46-like protein